MKNLIIVAFVLLSACSENAINTEGTPTGDGTKCTKGYDYCNQSFKDEIVTKDKLIYLQDNKVQGSVPYPLDMDGSIDYTKYREYLVYNVGKFGIDRGFFWMEFNGLNTPILQKDTINFIKDNLEWYINFTIAEKITLNENIPVGHTYEDINSQKVGGCYFDKIESLDEKEAYIITYIIDTKKQRTLRKIGYFHFLMYKGPECEDSCVINEEIIGTDCDGNTPS